MLNDIIQIIDSEIARLTEARRLLGGGGSGISPSSSGKGPRKRRAMSAEARARIAEGQRRRWARQRKGQ